MMAGATSLRKGMFRQFRRQYRHLYFMSDHCQNVNQQFGKLRAEFFESLTFNYFRPAKKKEKIVLGFCSQRGSEGDDEHGVGEVEGKVRVMMRAKELPRVMRRLITGWLATLGLTDHQEMCGHHSYTDVHIGSWYFPFLFLCCWSFIFGICI